MKKQDFDKLTKSIKQAGRLHKHKELATRSAPGGSFRDTLRTSLCACRAQAEKRVRFRRRRRSAR